MEDEPSDPMQSAASEALQTDEPSLACNIEHPQYRTCRLSLCTQEELQLTYKLKTPIIQLHRLQTDAKLSEAANLNPVHPSQNQGQDPQEMDTNLVSEVTSVVKSESEPCQYRTSNLRSFAKEDLKLKFRLKTPVIQLPRLKTPQKRAKGRAKSKACKPYVKRQLRGSSN